MLQQADKGGYPCLSVFGLYGRSEFCTEKVYIISRRSLPPMLSVKYSSRGSSSCCKYRIIISDPLSRSRSTQASRALTLLYHAALSLIEKALHTAKHEPVCDLYDLLDRLPLALFYPLPVNAEDSIIDEVHKHGLLIFGQCAVFL